MHKIQIFLKKGVTAIVVAKPLAFALDTSCPVVVPSAPKVPPPPLIVVVTVPVYAGIRRIYELQLFQNLR